MADCPPDCGLCCEKIVLSDDVLERLYDPELRPLPLVHPKDPQRWAGEDRVFAQAHWTRVREARYADVFVQGPADDDTTGTLMACDAYVDGRCSVYDTRPPICALYPFYGDEPAAGSDVPDHNTCTYHDEVPGRRVLPLTVLR